jgi:hypothetical protein
MVSKIRGMNKNPTKPGKLKPTSHIIGSPNKAPIKYMHRTTCFRTWPLHNTGVPPLWNLLEDRVLYRKIEMPRERTCEIGMEDRQADGGRMVFLACRTSVCEGAGKALVDQMIRERPLK